MSVSGPIAKRLATGCRQRGTGVEMMKCTQKRSVVVLAVTLCTWWTTGVETVAAEQSQTALTAPVSGMVIDETGGVLPGAVVLVLRPDGADTVAETVTGGDGRFSVDVPAGQYLVRVSMPSFSTVDQEVVAASGAEPVTVRLAIEALEETLDVEVDPANALRLNTLASLTAQTLSDEELLALPTDEQDLVEYLMLLAGADSSGDFEEDASRFIIDGWDEGRLPDPDEIAQIYIDPAPLRADGSGDGPRIEIITRPGTGRWRSSLDFNFADESLDATTPGERTKPARQTRDVDVDLGGPIIPGLVDVDVEVSTQSQERAANSLIAITPEANVFEAVVRPQTEHQFEVDADIALSRRHSLGVDLDFETRRTENSRVGGFTLPERGSDEERGEWALQVSERRLGNNSANDFRVRVSRQTSQEFPRTIGVAINVADAFNRGGSTSSDLDRDARIQLENRLRWQRGDWSYRAGLEGRYDSNYSLSENNYNGTFNFASLHDYCRATGFFGVNCAPTRQIVEAALARGTVPVYLDARGDAVEISGVPTTYSVTTGDGELDIGELSLETFFQADRGFGEHASLRLGLRYEATNHSQDYLRANPLANFQYRWFEDTVIGVGASLSFRDFGDYERLIRNDGASHQKRLSISSPSFPDPFLNGVSTIDERRTTLTVLDPAYRAPYSFNPQLNLTQQLPGSMRINLSFSMNYGYRQRRIRNINAPFPGTPLPDEIMSLPRARRQQLVDRMRPFYPNTGNINQIESTGRSVSRRVQIRFQRRSYIDILGVQVSGSANYSYRWGANDNDFNNPYIPEWGLSNREHGLESQIRVRLPRELSLEHPVLKALARVIYQDTSLNLSVRMDSGRPYSIRSGRDLNGDQSTRDRPLGVARNSETGPARTNLNLTFTKYFRPAQQPRGADGRRRDARSVRFQARISNLLNSSQIRGYSGVLSSPLFGLPTGYQRGRTIRLSMHADF